MKKIALIFFLLLLSPLTAQASYDLSTYGVVCDGSTDTTSYINAALLSISASGGGIAELPIGICRTTDSINIQSGVELKGQGRSATIIKTVIAPAYQIVKFDTGVLNAGISKLGIDGNSITDNNSSSCVFVNVNANDIFIRGIDSHSCGGNGIQSGGTRVDISYNYVHGNYENGIYIDGLDGSHLAWYNKVYNNRVVDNSIGNINWDGIDVDPATRFTSVIGNYVHGNDIILYDAFNYGNVGAVVANNMIDASPETGIDIGTGSGYISDFLVTGNLIYDPVGCGICVNGNAFKGKVSTNLVINPTAEGILVEGSNSPHNIDISLNDIENPSSVSGSYSGARIKDGAYNINLSGNNISDTRSPKFMKYAIDTSADGAGVTVQANTVGIGVSGSFNLSMTDLMMATDANGNYGIGTAPVSNRRLTLESDTNDSVASMLIKNNSTGSSATSVLYFGNSSSAFDAFIFLNGTNNGTYGGARSLNILTNSASPVNLGVNNSIQFKIDGGGAINFGTYTGSTCTIGGYVTIKDIGGNTRKLAVCN